jgi:hypothetical protein
MVTRPGGSCGTSRRSASAMEYGSSPVQQPALQMRKGRVAPRARCARAVSHTRSKARGSRRK